MFCVVGEEELGILPDLWLWLFFLVTLLERHNTQTTYKVRKKPTANPITKVTVFHTDLF